jgi:hypothetical protein
MDNWNCPSCGEDLHDISSDINVDKSLFDAFDNLLRYYCENCDDFYGSDSLKEEILTR